MKNSYKYISQLNVLMLNIGYAKHNADWNWKNVNSPFARIYYVTEGNAEIVFNDMTQILKPGNLYIIPPYTMHSYKCDGIFCHYYLHIYEDQQSNFDNFLSNWNFPTEVQGTNLDRQLMERLWKINPNMTLPQSNPQSYDNNATLISNIVRNQKRTMGEIIESRGIIFQLLSRFFNGITRKVDVNDDRILNCILYIRRNINEKIKIEDLAKSCSLSKDRFIHLFKKEIGIPPLSYINQKKIEKAQLLLVTGTMPLKEISYLLSFDDHSYFTRLFKKSVGVSPIMYRMQHKAIK